jgi:hypothetical protein
VGVFVKLLKLDQLILALLEEAGYEPAGNREEVRVIKKEAKKVASITPMLR